MLMEYFSRQMPAAAALPTTDLTTIIANPQQVTPSQQQQQQQSHQNHSSSIADVHNSTCVVNVSSSPPSASMHQPSDDSITTLITMADKMDSLLPMDPSVDLFTPIDNPHHNQRISSSNQIISPSPLLHDSISLSTVHTAATAAATLNQCDETTSLQTQSTSPPTPIPESVYLLSHPNMSSNSSPSSQRSTTTNMITNRKIEIQKQARKPKTYSKPVASRFCHICSRMPRRGQGSAICKRMAEGFCRKIVCEQCVNEQGWDFQEIRRNMANWLCPHCAGICPARSQCHIYNRINARRKRVGNQQTQQRQAHHQPPAIIQNNIHHIDNNINSSILTSPKSSSTCPFDRDLTLRDDQYPLKASSKGHHETEQKQEALLMESIAKEENKVEKTSAVNVMVSKLTNRDNSCVNPVPHILQPPPNFRLNLPPQYAQI